MMPRPVLGHITTSAGQSLAVDSDVVIGRDPKATVEPGRSAPRVLTLPGSEVSRVHCRIVVDGWDARIVDLGSTNGTVLARPGRPRERLAGSDSRPLRSGDVIELAEGIWITVVELA